MPITASAFFWIVIKSGFSSIIYLNAAIPYGAFCIQIIMANATNGPAAATEAPVSNDFGIISDLIQVISKHLPPSFLKFGLQS
jgi:hypothetical protein